MKLTNTQSMKAKSGMTLLELTVVILVLLSLISILFVGARAWKKGSDRATNILNFRNAQQAMRGHANMKQILISGACTSDDIYGPTAYLKKPTPPNTEIGTEYTTGTTVPEVGTLWLTAAYGGANATADFAPSATVYADW
jgi:prepilin-type N-terminal cleavage/methylation domain-containing protein